MGYSNYNSSTNPANVFHSDNTEDYFVSLSNGEAALIMIDWPGAGTENDPYLIYTKEKLDLRDDLIICPLDSKKVETNQRPSPLFL